MTSTWKKMDKNGKNYAKWKVTKLKRGSGEAVHAFLSRVLPGCHVVPSMVLCILALCSSLPRPLFCFKTWGSPALPYWDGLLDNNTQVCEFGEINTQESKNCGISPLNAVPREGVLSLPQHWPHFHEELPRKMFSRKLNLKTLFGAQNTSTLRHLSKSCVFTSLLKNRWF